MNRDYKSQLLLIQSSKSNFFNSTIWVGHIDSIKAILDFKPLSKGKGDQGRSEELP